MLKLFVETVSCMNLAHKCKKKCKKIITLLYESVIIADDGTIVI